MRETRHAEVNRLQTEHKAAIFKRPTEYKVTWMR